jgi:RHS repeat-associated protein
MYTGRFYVDKLDMYYFRARWFDSNLGRFTNRDPLGFVDGVNTYASKFFLSGVDYSGSLSQQLVDLSVGTCGKHDFITKWVPSPTETRGWIFQLVEIEMDKATNCNGSRVTYDLSDVDMENWTNFSGKSCAEYWEVWRVDGPNITAANPFDREAEHGGDASLDYFSGFGTVECSRCGWNSKLGAAFFMSDKQWNDLPDTMKREVRSRFSPNTGVVQGAYALSSACNGKAVRSRMSHLMRLIGTKSRSGETNYATTKYIEWSWDCCKACKNEAKNDCTRTPTIVDADIEGIRV